MDKNKLLDDFFTMLLNTLQPAKDFGAEQIPLVCKEYLAYNFYTALLCLVVGIILLPLGIFLYRKGCKMTETPACMPFFILGVLGMIVSGPIVITNAQEMIKIHYAPRVYLLDYVSVLVKRNDRR